MISIVLGTRPEMIKLAPLMKRCEKENINYKIIHTGQHYSYELDKIFFDEIGLRKPDYNLSIGSGTHAEETGKALIGIEKILMNDNPEFVLVYGDTNSTLAGALAAVKLHIPVAHIESGLRSFDRRMPEEINRIVVDHISDILFAPTKNAIKNLKSEGISNEKIFFTYDMAVDACMMNYEIAKNSEILKQLDMVDEFVLVTLHRAENVDTRKNLCGILDALMEISKSRGVIFPVHPRTLKNLKSFNIFEKYSKNIKFIKPVGFFDFLKLLGSASCVVTDSGGIQKEALILKTPCVTTRTTTEWIETIDLNANVIVGSDKEKIVEEVSKRSSKDFREFMKKIENPYGDGKTSERILKYLKMDTKNVAEVCAKVAKDTKNRKTGK